MADWKLLPELRSFAEQVLQYLRRRSWVASKESLGRRASPALRLLPSKVRPAEQATTRRAPMGSWASSSTTAASASANHFLARACPCSARRANYYFGMALEKRLEERLPAVLLAKLPIERKPSSFATARGPQTPRLHTPDPLYSHTCQRLK